MVTPICVPIIGPSLAEVALQVERAQAVAEIAEWRVDRFSEEASSADALKPIREACRIPLVLTLRRAAHGGQFDGGISGWMRRLTELSALNPDYIDVDSDATPEDLQRLRQLAPKAKILVSYHNFNATPLRLNQLFQAMRKLPGDLYKIATMARSSVDVLRMLVLAQSANRSESLLIALCMGEVGEPTRILGPLFRMPWSFASLEPALATAPGQQTAVQMKELYGKLGPDTLLFGLIGDPVDKSLSHLTHNAVFRTLELPAIYLKFRVTPDSCGTFLDYARRLPFRGLSVTMPLKEVTAGLADELEPTAAQLEAVNTLLFQKRRCLGYNTDGIGAMDALEEALAEPIKGKRCLILGAGGAATAIAFEAQRRAAQVTLVNRDLARAQALADKIGCSARPLAELGEQLQKGCDILIQATSVGMTPDERLSLVNPDWLRPEMTVFETIWRPKETQLLRDAKAKGCFTISGVEMFINQAVEQFMLWFDKKLDRQQVKNILQQALDK